MTRLVVGGMIVDNLLAPSRVLAARRTRPPSLRGRWEFPGGKAEPGESPQGALIRELREELGISVAVGAELVEPDRGTWQISKDLEMRLWFVTVGEGDPVAADSHDKLAWLDAGSLESLNWLDTDRQALPQLLEVLK